MNNFLFNAFLVLWTLVYGIIALPFLLLPPRLTVYSCKPWIYVILKALKIFCGLKYEIRGKENIPKDNKIVFMVKHHSAFETLLLAYVVKQPVYVLKKELMWMPLVGGYLFRSGMIPIDSKSYALSFKNMVRKVKNELLCQNRNVIIFPEGGRVGIKEDVKYQRGISIIYDNNKLHDVDFVPVAINCGVFWPFSTFNKKIPGNAVVSFLPPMKKSLLKNEFMNELKNVIDTESDKLVEEGLGQVAKYKENRLPKSV
ncbi:MAG: 1-acyl-sn-glycerol-3-phosphate acyltransferase [Rickettsiaceae bacterium H1]|nr:1-acyl-sn-glycerol-3-phosphate acyltransferase [Rickettsiaceae bacterium H1]